MSIINKLAVRGIRSFGNDNQDEQTISFASPLTLIVGENGCGKTTIIECLKYALTGEPPPGTDRGKTFVHDPKVFNSNLSLGRVRLTITDVTGKSLTCTRSMKLEQTKTGTTKFSTLDSTITSGDTHKEDGYRRVEQINNEMSSAMGVSKAILNNVIFCHQEDSNWPLDEGKKLKEKFDAIFGTTEYNKAIEKFIKMRKEYVEKQKLCLQEKKYLEATKKDADRKLYEVQRLEEKHEHMKAEVEVMNEQIAPIDEDIEKLLEKQKQIGELQAQRTILTTTISNNETNIENTKQKIRTSLVGDVDQLEDQLNGFKENKEKNAQKLNLLCREHETMAKQESNFRESVVKEQANTDMYANQLGQQQELISERFQAVKKLSDSLGIAFSDEEESQSLVGVGLQSSMKEILKEITAKEDFQRKAVSDEEKKDRDFQKMIDNARVEKTTCEANLETQRQTILKLTNEQENINEEISSIEAAMPMINRLVGQISSGEQELKKIQNETDVEGLEEEKFVVEAEKEALESKVTELEDNVEKLESISKVTNELEIKQADLTKDQNEFDRIKNKQNSNLKLLFPSKTVDKNFKNIANSYCDQVKQEISNMKSSLDEANKKSNRLQTEKNHERDQHKRKESELKSVEDRIYQLCDGREYMDVLTNQKEKVDKLILELASQKHSEGFYKNFISDIQQEPCCPLCHKNLESSERDNLKDEMDEKIRQAPNLIRSNEKKLQIENEKFHKLNEVKSSYDSIEKLKKEVEHLHTNSLRLENEYQQNVIEIEDLEMQMGEPESKFQLMSTTFFVDMNRLDDLIKSIAFKTREVDSLKAKVPAEMPQKSVAEVRMELRLLKTDLKNKSEHINKMNKEINETRSKINSLKDKINQLISKKVSYQEKVQGLDRLKSQLQEKEDEKTDLQQKMKFDEQKLKPMKEKLAELIREKDEIKAEAKQRFEAFQKSIGSLKENYRSILRLNDEISSYEEKNLEGRIKENQSKIEDLNKTIRKLQSDMKSKNQTIQQLSEEVNNQEKFQRNLEDNIELRKLETEKSKAEAELSELKKHIGDLDVRKMFADLQNLRSTREKITADRQSKQGQLTESFDRIKTAEKELNEPRFKNAQHNYNKQCDIEGALKAIVDDLLKFRAALENALLKFHADKMSQINKRIYELWNQIYKGNDIDYIKIKTDDGETKAASDKKRSYNYRVVQAKNGGSEIDMRGRCSAGQKVLASLIIRIALADTFSVNCGILALDEPTTNLDHRNINALCEALKAIIDEQEKSGRFMLIIITHDEEFVRSMDQAEFYHKLSRDNRGRSRIAKVQNV